MAYLKSELSEKNPYYISKHRYYELKHFCMQYREWKDMYNRLDAFPRYYQELYAKYSDQPGDPTARIAQMRADIVRNVDLIESVAMEADNEIGHYILRAVTEDLSYPQLQTIYGIPCGKDMYYDRYRKFYFLLSNRKGL